MTNLAFPDRSQASGTNQEDVLFLDRRGEDRRTSFLDLTFTPFLPQGLAARVTEIGMARQPFVYLCTPNVDHMVRLSRTPDLRPLYEQAWAVVNDSRILTMLARLSGLALPACPGSDLTRVLFEQTIDRHEPVVIIGSHADEIAALTARYHLTDVRWHQPPFGLKTNPEAMAAAAEFVVANPARFTFLCVGSPQQEMLGQAIKNTGQAIGIGLCVGASIEFLTGSRKRAPVWMQAMSLEWLFRLISEPGKLWRRYLIDGPAIFSIWRDWQRQRDGDPGRR